jgi:hypothetical protein
MSFVFLNLVLRFLLEITSLIAVGMYGWQQSDTWHKYLYAIGFPLILSVIWGVFNVPGDPSRSGNAPVVVPGVVRLLIEAAFFACGVYAGVALGYKSFATTFVVVLILHYMASFNRIEWLLTK